MNLPALLTTASPLAAELPADISESSLAVPVRGKSAAGSARGFNVNPLQRGWAKSEVLA